MGMDGLSWLARGPARRGHRGRRLSAVELAQPVHRHARRLVDRSRRRMVLSWGGRWPARWAWATPVPRWRRPRPRSVDLETGLLLYGLRCVDYLPGRAGARAGLSIRQRTRHPLCAAFGDHDDGAHGTESTRIEPVASDEVTEIPGARRGGARSGRNHRVERHVRPPRPARPPVGRDASRCAPPTRPLGDFRLYRQLWTAS